MQEITKKDYTRLENELHLKNLQIKSLLGITQAINNNVSEPGLYKMYRDFLAWEMSVDKMALLTQEKEGWTCAACIDTGRDFITEALIAWLNNLERLHTITEDDPEVLRGFDIVIPVQHKEEPIAYALIGGFEKEDNPYSKVQFITTITNIIAVAIENKRLFKHRLEQEKFRKEMEFASEVQRWLLPQSFPENERYDVGFFYKPHFNVGGDYFDFFPIDENNFYYCIADISGKGVSAALLMANFQAILRGRLLHRHIDLDDVVRHLNYSVHNITRSDKFITFFIAKVDLIKNRVRYVNAGHNPPIFFYKDQIEFMDKGTTVLGAVKDLPFIEVGEKRIEYDTTLLNFTDGLVDLKNDSGENFTVELLKEMLLQHGEEPCKDFVCLLQDTLEDFKGAQKYPDDIAVLTFKILQKKAVGRPLQLSNAYENQ